MKKQEKFKQISKEVKAVLFSMLAIILFWVVSGFLVNQLHITVFHTPLWVITGCLGTWIFSIILVTWLMNHVFKDFSLDDTEEKEQAHE